MRFEELINMKLKEAGEIPFQRDLEMNAAAKVGHMPYRYYDQKDLIIAREILRDIYYLKYELFFSEYGKDAYKHLSDMALEKDEKGKAFHYRLCQLHDDNQLKELKKALSVIEEAINEPWDENNIPDSEIVRAFIDSTGKPHIYYEDIAKDITKQL